MIAVLSKNRTDMIKEYNYDVLTRILFLYAKLNDGLYVQGMNEIAALMLLFIYLYIISYHCFATDESPYLRKSAEIDAFFCFSILMTDFKENFITNV